MVLFIMVNGESMPGMVGEFIKIKLQDINMQGAGRKIKKMVMADRIQSQPSMKEIISMINVKVLVF